MKVLVLILISSLLAIGTSQAQTRHADSLALVMLYNATGGANWTHTWDLTRPMDFFDGVTLSNGRVTHIDLNTNNLVGTRSCP